MKIGIIACGDGKIWGGEKGISNHITNKLKEVDEIGESEVVAFHAVSGNLPRKEDVETFAGFVISGSHHSVNDNQEWISKLVEFVLLVFNSKRPRLFGICFGHQLIAKALKGKVERNPSRKYVWGTGRIWVDDLLTNRPCFENALGALTEFTMMKSHGECVTVLPDSAVCVGRSPSCDYEILMYGDKALSMQGHPDLTKKEMLTNILPRLRKSKLIDRQEEKKSIENLDDKDQLKLMKLVVGFLSEKN